MSLTAPPTGSAPGSAGPMPAILQCAANLGIELEKVRDAQPIFLSTSEKATALQALIAVESQVQELRLRVMAASGDLADETGSHDVAAWLANATRVRVKEARREQKLATALDRRFPAVAAGMRDGAVNAAQAHVITHTLDELNSHGDISDEILAQAEEHLVDEAAHFGPRPLARLARHILDVLAPEVAEAADARRLAALEADAETKTRLNLRRVGDGTTRISGLIPDASATRLVGYLEAFTNPRLADSAVDTTANGTADSTSEGEADSATGDTAAGGSGSTSDAAPTGTSDLTGRMPMPKKLGRAFVQFLEAIDPRRLPIHGGDATTLVVTIDLERLRKDLGTADLLGTSFIPDTGDPATWTCGDRITASQARRLACNAQIIPAVLGSDGEILDLGRSTRLFTKAQRRALLLRDKTCRAEGCERPGRWCEAHHADPWSSGGPTDLANAVLLCSADHHRAHDPDYETTRLPNGDLRFHRRTPLRTPRRT